MHTNSDNKITQLLLYNMYMIKYVLALAMITARAITLWHTPPPLLQNRWRFIQCLYCIAHTSLGLITLVTRLCLSITISLTNMLPNVFRFTILASSYLVYCEYTVIVNAFAEYGNNSRSDIVYKLGTIRILILLLATLTTTILCKSNYTGTPRTSLRLKATNHHVTVERLDLSRTSCRISGLSHIARFIRSFAVEPVPTLPAQRIAPVQFHDIDAFALTFILYVQLAGQYILDYALDQMCGVDLSATWIRDLDVDIMEAMEKQGKLDTNYLNDNIDDVVEMEVLNPPTMNHGSNESCGLQSIVIVN